MVVVYFESQVHAEIVAIFDTEESYDICLPALEKEAEANGMFVTESVIDEVSIQELYSKLKK
jgi:hypothetical protein